MTTTPTKYFAEQVRRFREERRWTQPELAARCQSAGLKWDRSIVANVEAGRRASVTVREVFTLAHVLSVPPTLLLLPVKTGEPVEVADGLVLHPGLALRWMAGDDGPFDKHADRAKFGREALPLVLYGELGRSHRAIDSALMDVRAEEAIHGADSEQAVAARKEYAEELQVFAQILVRMDLIGMQPPPIEQILHDDAARFGVKIPESVEVRPDGPADAS